MKNETTFNLLHTSARSISFKNQTRSKASQFFTYFKLHRRNVFIFVNKIMMEYMIYVTKTLICRTSERYCGNKNIYT